MLPLDSDFFAIKIGPKDDNNKNVMLVIDPNKHGGPDKMIASKGPGNVPGLLPVLCLTRSRS
jgi:hypothetical protein